MTRFPFIIAALFVLSISIPTNPAFAQTAKKTTNYFGIHVVDAQTGRGIPLATLATTGHIRYVTDSAGWVAFLEPDLMNRGVWFSAESPGYEMPKDSFGNAGFRTTPVSGNTLTVKMQRTQIAERMYRITGAGIFSDSILLGKPTPTNAQLNAAVIGQDSVQAVPYQGRLFWLWGDTDLPQYPLGNFQVTAAWSDLPGKGGLDPEQGIKLQYLEDPEKPGQARHAAPGPEPGPIWIFGLFTLPDASGKERLVGHFTRQKSLAEVAEHGLMVFNDTKGIFERLVIFDNKRLWQAPSGNAVHIQNEDGDFIYFTTPFPQIRVRATWADIQKQGSYQTLVFDTKTKAYRWQSDVPATAQTDEPGLVKQGVMTEAQRRYDVRDAATGESVLLHGTSVDWNPYRKCWIMIGMQSGGKSSLLGELWYAEAAHPDGPWTKAVQIATHPKYTFYNVRHHLFFDQKGGQIIYFEGTYTTTFSGNPTPTPRYEYNQILYRLDLADERLRPAHLP